MVRRLEVQFAHASRHFRRERTDFRVDHPPKQGRAVKCLVHDHQAEPRHAAWRTFEQWTTNREIEKNARCWVWLDRDRMGWNGRTVRREVRRAHAAKVTGASSMKSVICLFWLERLRPRWSAVPRMMMRR